MTLGAPNPKVTAPPPGGRGAGDAPDARREGAQHQRREAAPSQADLVRASLLRCPAR